MPTSDTTQEVRCSTPITKSKFSDHVLDVIGNPDKLFLQYGKETVRKDACSFFRSQGVDYIRIDRMNNVLIKMLRTGDNLTKAIESITKEGDELRDFCKKFEPFLNELYENLKLEADKIIGTGCSIDNDEDYFRRFLCQVALSLSAKYKISIHFDLAEVDFDEAMRGRKGYTESELRQIMRLHKKDPGSLTHIRFFYYGNDVTDHQNPFASKSYVPLSDDRACMTPPPLFKI